MRRAYALALGTLLWAGAAGAAEITDVASSFDEHNRFDFRFRIGYEHLERRAQIKREIQGLTPGQDSTLLFKDLLYSSYRDQVSLRAEIGLYHDLALHFELPIIIEQSTTYAYDQSAGSACVFAPNANPNCVDQTNSTTIADGLVPNLGYDAQNNVAALAGPNLFRGALRGARGGSGLDAFDTFNVGLTWAALSQMRDDTKPTWTVTLEGQFSIGNVMRFNRAAPDANHGVSDGTHRLVVRTALSKRFKYLEPYWQLWYVAPFSRGSDTLFTDYSRAQKTKNPQMRAGVTAGTEIIPFENADKQYKIAIDVRGRVMAWFAGRGYSEMWELLASAPPLDCNTNTARLNPACDPTAPMNPYQGQPFTGVTTIENYPALGADIGFLAQIGPYFRVRTGFEYTHERAHFITGDDIGTPMTGSGRVTRPDEFNPAYRPIIDQVGRRYRIDNVNNFNFYLYAQAMF